MAYPQVQVKQDEGAIEKYFYWCQTRGCGAVINPEYPVSLKTPSPKHCKDCQNPATRKAIEREFDEKLLVKG
jgi:hypothetical protein